MSSHVEQIKERLGIVEVVSSYIKVEKSGANYKAKCPFHNEKTPSFFISPSRGSYYCFGCGAKGDIFSFVQEFEGVDFMGALRILAQRSGVELVREDPQMRSERERLYRCLESATILFQKNLYTKPEHKGVVDYLIGRGLTKETIKEWRIGFAENGWRNIMDYLKEKRFSDSDLEKVGLIKRKEGDEAADVPRFYDRFRGRIMFPLFDNSNRVIGFSGRILVDDGKSAKYLNSPETELFKKSHILYGFHKAKNAIREKDFSILVEGQMDLLMSQQAGFTNTVGVSGTALTESHLELLRRLSNKIVMVFDPDKAGVKAAERGAQMALSLGMEVKVAALPVGEDPALFILHHPDKWKSIIEGATHIVEFMLDYVVAKKAQGLTDDRGMAADVKSMVLPLIARLPGSTEQSSFIALAYKKTGMREDALWDDVRAIIKSTGVSEVHQGMSEQVKKVELRKHAIERKITGIIFWQEALEKPGIDVESALDRYQKIIGQPIFETVMKEAFPDKNELILEAEVTFDGSERLKEELDELFINLEEDYLKEQFAVALLDLSKAEHEKDTEKAKLLLVKCKELSERISRLPKFK